MRLPNWSNKKLFKTAWKWVLNTAKSSITFLEDFSWRTVQHSGMHDGLIGRSVALSYPYGQKVQQTPIQLTQYLYRKPLVIHHSNANKWSSSLQGDLNVIYSTTGSSNSWYTKIIIICLASINWTYTKVFPKTTTTYFSQTFLLNKGYCAAEISSTKIWYPKRQSPWLRKSLIHLKHFVKGSIKTGNSLNPEKIQSIRLVTSAAPKR